MRYRYSPCWCLLSRISTKQNDKQEGSLTKEVCMRVSLLGLFVIATLLLTAGPAPAATDIRLVATTRS